MKNSLEEQLRSFFPFWDRLTNDEKQLLADNTVEVHYTQGTSLHRGDEDCVGVLLLKSGQLRTYMLSEDGRDITLYRLYPDDVCILSASCVLESITFDVFIDAETDCDVLLISSNIFKQVAEKNIYAQNFGHQLATTRFSEVMWSMQQILFMKTDQRLAIFLWDEINKNKTDSIALTQEQIAKYIGSAREVVSRMLKYFANEGIVEFKRGCIKVIDKQKLRELTK